MFWQKMKKLIRYLFWGLTIFLMIFTVIDLFLPRYLGMAEAKYDLWRNHYEIRVYGYRPAFFDRLYAQKLKRLGIKYRRVAGSIVSRSQICYVLGYNAVIKRAISKDLLDGPWENPEPFWSVIVI